MKLIEKKLDISFIYNYDLNISYDFKKFLDIKDIFTKMSIEHYCTIDENSITIYMFIPSFETGIKLINSIKKALNEPIDAI